MNLLKTQEMKLKINWENPLLLIKIILIINILMKKEKLKNKK